MSLVKLFTNGVIMAFNQQWKSMVTTDIRYFKKNGGTFVDMKNKS